MTYKEASEMIRGLFFGLAGFRKLVVEHKGEFHVDTEVLDRAIVCKFDFVLRNPSTTDSFY